MYIVLPTSCQNVQPFRRFVCSLEKMMIQLLSPLNNKRWRSNRLVYRKLLRWKFPPHIYPPFTAPLAVYYICHIYTEIRFKLYLFISCQLKSPHSVLSILAQGRTSIVPTTPDGRRRRRFTPYQPFSEIIRRLGHNSCIDELSRRIEKSTKGWTR